MLTLGGSGYRFEGFGSDLGRRVVRLTDRTDRPKPLREAEALIVREATAPPGFACYVVPLGAGEFPLLPHGAPFVALPSDYSYLRAGDIVRLHPERGSLRVLFRHDSPHNTFLTTERCNSYCLMCSQPPRDVDDGWLVDEILDVIPLIDPATVEVGFSGGEPTLLGDGLLRIVTMMKSYLPRTAVHLLSNGRTFSDAAFTEAFAAISHPDLMVGIPVYSDTSTIHDYVVQADGALDETIRGILNLKRLRQRVEIRVVVHQQTYTRLPQLAEFIVRNLTFVDHVALMGLEITGFTRANLNALWIDPFEYRAELANAALTLERSGLRVSIYNHQLCTIDRAVWHLARKSISDWKNEYIDACTGCGERLNCGGFFASGRSRYSAHIAPIITPEAESRQFRQIRGSLN